MSIFSFFLKKTPDVNQRLVQRRSLQNSREILVRELDFTDVDGNATTLAWPPILENLQPDGSIAVLGRSLLKHLENIGIINEDVIENEELRRYYCNLEFRLSSKSEFFLIKLRVVYQDKRKDERFPITKDEVLDYLNMKILGICGDDELEGRVQLVLNLLTIRCYINGLELL